MIHKGRFWDILLLEAVSVSLAIATLVDFELPVLFVGIHEILNLETDARVEIFVFAIIEKFLEGSVDPLEIDVADLRFGS